jgi:hypothetical protein
MTDDLERVWKVAFVAYSKVLSRHFLEGTEENRENLGYDNQ